MIVWRPDSNREYGYPSFINIAYQCPKCGGIEVVVTEINSSCMMQIPTHWHDNIVYQLYELVNNRKEVL